MRNRLIELIDKALDKHTSTIENYAHPKQEWIADYLIENGVIVPPCKVGDMVYWIDDGKIKCEEVFEISIHIDGILINTGIQFCLKPDAVFLTREEAKQALKGGAE